MIILVYIRHFLCCFPGTCDFDKNLNERMNHLGTFSILNLQEFYNTAFPSGINTRQMLGEEVSPNNVLGSGAGLGLEVSEVVAQPSPSCVTFGQPLNLHEPQLSMYKRLMVMMMFCPFFHSLSGVFR